VRNYPAPCICPDPSCDVIGFKLLANGHAKGCICGECRGRGSQRSGARTEARRHKRLSAARVPTDEYPWAYPITVTTQDKAGKQVPVKFWDALGGAFFKGAFKQVYRKIPVGANVLPAVYIEHDDGRAFLVVDVSERSWK
jgi:hypothetical protein